MSQEPPHYFKRYTSSLGACTSIIHFCIIYYIVNMGKKTKMNTQTLALVFFFFFFFFLMCNREFRFCLFPFLCTRIVVKGDKRNASDEVHHNRSHSNSVHRKVQMFQRNNKLFSNEHTTFCSRELFRDTEVSNCD